jgi:hypothetical protein
MTAKPNATEFTVLLCQRVILNERVCFDAERELRLPIEPFVGLRLYNTLIQVSEDDNEEEIEVIGYDLKTGRVSCYLTINDFRPEASGVPDFTEQDIRDEYRDWTLILDDFGKSTGNGYHSDR